MQHHIVSRNTLVPVRVFVLYVLFLNSWVYWDIKIYFFQFCILDQIPKESAKITVKKVMATACPVFEEKVDCNRNDERHKVYPLVSCPGLKQMSAKEGGIHPPSWMER